MWPITGHTNGTHELWEAARMLLSEIPGEWLDGLARRDMIEDALAG